MQALKLVKTTELSHEQWLNERRRGIGGSDAAAIAGVHRWKSALEVWLEKMGQIQPQEENEKMYWGTRLEEVVAEEFSKRTCKKVQRCNFILQNPKYPFMLANIDRAVVGEKAGLECKTAGEWSGKNIIENDFLPEHILQVQHYLMVTGWERWYLAILIGGQKFLYKEVLPDFEIIGYLTKIESDFWGLVEAGIPPLADGSEACSNILEKMYPKSNGEAIELPSSALGLIEQYNTAKNDVKAAEYLKDDATNQLKNLLGDNEKGRVGQYVVNWRSQTQNRTDTKALKEKFPDVAAQVLKETTFRKMEIKEEKSK